jgi:hypothetical protein
MQDLEIDFFGNHMRTHHPLRFYNENLGHQMGGSDEKQRLLKMARLCLVLNLVILYHLMWVVKMKSRVNFHIE